MRPPRIPATLPDSLPISFSYRIHPHNQRVEVVIDAPDEWSAALLDGLALLSHFTQQAKRNLEAGYRDLRADQTRAELHAKYAIIQHAYQLLRDAGIKRRAAIRALVSDASLPFHGLWTFTEFNACIRSIVVRSPKLTAVPASGDGAR